MAMSDNYDATALPSLKPLSFCKQVLLFFLTPYLILMANSALAKKRNNINIIKKDLPLSSKKHGAFSTDFNLPDIKHFCMQNNCSVHDYFSAVLGTVLYEYFEEENTVLPREIDVLVPFSFR